MAAVHPDLTRGHDSRALSLSLGHVLGHPEVTSVFLRSYPIPYPFASILLLH